MVRAMGQHRLEPVIDRVIPFEALDYLASGAHFGKICLRHPN